jgi:hypothetical protein
MLVLAAPAAAEVWSGWVGIAQKTRGSKQALNALAREISAGLTSGADNRLSTTAPRCREGP